MPRVFPAWTNTIARYSLLGVLLGGAGPLWVVFVFARSSYGSGAGIARVQPVPFSHEHRVGVLSIDCRYCHTSVETSAVAGIPPTKTCMNCHSVLFNSASYLEPIRESFRTDKSIEWNKVHRLADFVYFNHSIHINKGVGCSTCHGQVNQMPLVFQANTLLMQWCVDCHRNPEQALRSKDQVFNMDWKAPDNQAEIGAKLKEEYKIRTTAELTSCPTCHR